MPDKQLIIRLKTVKYGGQNLGNDIRFDVTADTNSTSFKKSISHGSTATLSREVLKKDVSGSSVNISFSVAVIEEDIVYNDVGSATSTFTVSTTAASPQSHSFNVTVIGIGGRDKGKKATFTLTFEAVLTELTRYIPDASKGWLKVRLESDASTQSLPYQVKVKWTGKSGGRDYFVIQEGAHKNKPASVKLKSDGNSWLTETGMHTGPVALSYSKGAHLLKNLATGKQYQAIVDPNNPLPNGVYDIEIPDYPHPGGAYYEATASRAKTWFRIGHSGDRYLHTGTRSAGCLTVTETNRWDELYNAIITGRKGDGVSIGTVVITD